MSEDTAQTPPKGDHQKAEKYLSQLIELINQNRIQATDTDLTKFDPSSLQTHYSIALRDYQIEISHSKQSNSGKDSFVMIFNNLKNVSEGSSEKVILAYVYLEEEQFSKFRIAADRQIAERKKAEEERKFKEVLEPIDELLNQVSTSEPDHADSLPESTQTQSEEKPAESFVDPDPIESGSDSIGFDSPQIHQI